MLSLASVSCLVWDLTGSQLPRMKVWAISDTKPALNHWSFSRHRPGPDWFTFMQILSFQTGFSRFHALGIGPHLLKQPVPAGCDSFNSLPPCFWVAISQAAQEDWKWFIRLTYVKAIQGNLIQILGFLIGTNHTTWLVFSEQKTELEEHLSMHELWTPHESWLRSTSLFFWHSRISMWWHFRGLNPVLLHTKPKLYHGANQALS